MTRGNASTSSCAAGVKSTNTVEVFHSMISLSTTVFESFRRIEHGTHWKTPLFVRFEFG